MEADGAEDARGNGVPKGEKRKERIELEGVLDLDEGDAPDGGYNDEEDERDAELHHARGAYLTILNLTVAAVRPATVALTLTEPVLRASMRAQATPASDLTLPSPATLPAPAARANLTDRAGEGTLFPLASLISMANSALLPSFSFPVDIVNTTLFAAPGTT